MTLLIIFNDGTEKRIENVRNYEYGKGTGCFQYSLINSTSLGFVQKEGLRYFGPEDMWVEPKPEVDFKAEFNYLIKKIDDEMWVGEEINDELDRTHNRALKIAKAIVIAKRNRIYEKE